MSKEQESAVRYVNQDGEIAREKMLQPEFGELVRQAREDIKMSQTELAQAIERRNATVSDIENGKSIPDLTTLVRLAVVLERPIAYFFPDWVHHAVGAEGKTKHEQLLLKEFRKLDDERNMKIVIEQVKTLANMEVQAYIEYMEKVSEESKGRKQYPGALAED